MLAYKPLSSLPPNRPPFGEGVFFYKRNDKVNIVGVVMKNKVLERVLYYSGKYLLNLLILVDQAINTILGGDPDHTISGRIGYHAGLGKPWALKCERVINAIFFWQQDHCKRAIEWCVIRRKLREERRNKL